MKKGRAGQFKVRTNGTVVCIQIYSEVDVTDIFRLALVSCFTSGQTMHCCSIACQFCAFKRMLSQMGV